ncbi:MAG TPA: amidohydrolase family protein [Thermoleophilaceae bacterium]|nr:amidohydrolase family protein [Thermoleophilaceae bacterium]
MRSDDDLKPWFDLLTGSFPGLRLLDVHTHTGADDPDGFSCSAEELLASLERAGGARAVVFTMHEPAGYPAANDRVLREAEASGGRLIPFCRVDPRAGALPEAERCLDAGARGIKLHPRAESFELGDPALRPVFALAAERGVPVLVHAGRGIPALGRHALEICERHPEMPLILAHAGICDLAWIWREAPSHPNLLFDTSWWNATDLVALYSLVPPGQILYGSDMPYGTPLFGALLALRPALEVGLTADQIGSVAGGQAERLLAGEPPADLGPAPGPPERVPGPLLDRVHAAALGAVSRIFAGSDPTETLDLARLACQVPAGTDHEEVFVAIAGLISRGPPPEEGPVPYAGALHLAMTAVLASRTPSVPVPAA